MLILRRKAGEAISIGDHIRVVIVEVKGNHVKIGIDAPIGVPIYRDELLSKIRAENKKAAETRPDVLQSVSLKEMLKKVQEGHPAKKKLFSREKQNDD